METQDLYSFFYKKECVVIVTEIYINVLIFSIRIFRYMYDIFKNQVPIFEELPKHVLSELRITSKLTIFENI